MNNGKQIYILLGPSGAGKTTLGYYVRDQLHIPELVSATTRPARVGEINGISYHFVTEEQFNKLELIEDVVYSGNHYGTFTKEVEEKLSHNGKVYAIMNIDGVNAMKKKYGDMVKVIYCKCDPQTLYQRMLERGDDKYKAKERVDYLYKTGELTFDNYADLIVQTDKYSLDECKQIIRKFVE